MFGGYPQEEVEKLNEYWNEFKGLKEELFDTSKDPYYQFKIEDVTETVNKNKSVNEYKKNYVKTFEGFKEYLYKEFITQALEVNINREEEVVAQYIYKHLEKINLIDKYTAYQALDDAWDIVSNDLEIIQTEGFQATKIVDPNMVIKKKDEKEYEVQDGWKGHILPFEIVQEKFLAEDLRNLKVLEKNNQKLLNEIEEVLNGLTEEEQELGILNDDKTAFVNKEVENKAKEFYADLIEEPEEKPLTKAAINKKISELMQSYKFEEGSTEEKITSLYKTQLAQKEANKFFKNAEKELHEKTKTTIENLSEEQVKEILVLKWIEPLNTKITTLSDIVIDGFISKLIEFKKKYQTTYVEVAKNIFDSEKNVSSMLDQIVGNDFDTKGLKEFQKVLRGEI